MFTFAVDNRKDMNILQLLRYLWKLGELSLSTYFGNNFLNFPHGNTYIKRLLYFIYKVWESEREREVEIWLEKGGSSESASYKTFEKILNVIAGNLAEVYHVSLSLFPPLCPSLSLYLSLAHFIWKL